MLHEMMPDQPSMMGQVNTGRPIATPTLTQRLEREKEFLEKRLADVTNALDQLKNNPSFTNLLEVVQRVS